MRQEKYIDLHMHSTYSDGQFSPAELVRMCVEKGLSAIALADHDCLDGVDEYVKEAHKAGLGAIAGVELSCVYRGRDLHVLGYGVDTKNQTFQKMLLQFRETRENRGLKIIEKLSAYGVHVEAKTIIEKAGDGAMGRPHIAEALVEGGYVKDFNEAFERYIGEDCPAYVEKFKMSPDEAIRHIHGASGLAFVAHPGFYLEDGDSFSQLLDYGFDGIEVYHSKHGAETAARLTSIAEERGLLMSGGSDFHGFARRDVLGAPRVPFEFYEKISMRLESGAA